MKKLYALVNIFRGKTDDSYSDAMKIAENNSTSGDKNYLRRLALMPPRPAEICSTARSRLRQNTIIFD